MMTDILKKLDMLNAGSGKEALDKWVEREFDTGADPKIQRHQLAHMELWDSLYYSEMEKAQLVEALKEALGALEKENQVLREALRCIACYDIVDGTILTPGIQMLILSWPQIARQALAEADEIDD